MLKKLFEIGSHHIDNDNQRYKVILTNQIALLFLFVAFPFAILYWFLDTNTAIMAFVCMFICPASLLFNWMRMHGIAKFNLVFIANLFMFYLNILFTREGELMHPGSSLIQLGICILPFLIIGIEEMALFLISLIYSTGLLFLVPHFSGIIEPSASFDWLLSPDFEWIFVSCAVVVGGGQLYVFMNQSKRAEKTTQKLLDNMKEKNNEHEKDKKALDTYISEIQKAQEEDKKRAWASDGMAKFVEILRANNNDMKILAEKIVSTLVKYINANQGFLFVLNDNEEKNPFLELTAAYAYDRKKFVEKNIPLGDGLIGQAFLEKDVIFLTKVPQNYVNITSGLGEATPSCVLIVPLVINEEVFGVLELASFKKFEQFEIDFLKKLGENIAGTIANVKVNERTQRLLEDAQISQEQLRAQEEEMRQNMEELQATQEELARKSAEMEELRQKEKERTDAQLMSQRKLMEQFMEKANNKEKELKQRIAELEKQLA